MYVSNILFISFFFNLGNLFNALALHFPIKNFATRKLFLPRILVKKTKDPGLVLLGSCPFPSQLLVENSNK